MLRLIKCWCVLVLLSIGSHSVAADGAGNWLASLFSSDSAGIPDLTDSTDFENAERGFIAALEPPKIVNAEGQTVFDAGAYEFLEQNAPATVNPLLWRQSQLVAKHGLFKVVDGIYQVRGYDLANITFIQRQSHAVPPEADLVQGRLH